jgi:kumamolisin
LSARVPLEASRTHPEAGLHTLPDPDPSTPIQVTILLRRRAVSGSAEAGRLERILEGESPPLSREEAAASLGADPADLDRVTRFAESHGLTVLESSQARRSVRVSGTVAQMEAAFGTKLHTHATEGREYLSYDGVLSIPADLDGVVVGVLGFDQRPVARPRFQRMPGTME